MLDLKPLRIFLEIETLGSFAAAARSLRMTPASVTRIIARLEEDLGQQLFLRTTRQVSLTSFGALVAARYRPVLEDFDRATADVTGSTRADRGRLRLNVPLSMGVRLMPGLVESFALAYPNIALEVRMTDKLINIMEEPVDLAVRISGPPEDKSTIWRKICEVPLNAVASPALFERIPRPAGPEEVDPKICLSYGSRPETWHFSQGAIKRSVHAGDHIISNNGDFLQALAVAGQGIALLPDFITETDVQAGRVERLFPDWQVRPLWLTLYYPPYETLPPLVATFSEFFETYILSDAFPRAGVFVKR